MEMPEGSLIVGYADEIATVITKGTFDEIQWLLDRVMLRVLAWMGKHGLTLATEKTKIVLLTRWRINTVVQVRVDWKIIETKSTMKYLGVMLDTKLTFWDHISGAVTRRQLLLPH
uniref:Uncharacterized protein n=1 Tax=Cuerna arida TaxID=1464854 RepID=A0A1B6GNL6_9HEMI